MLQFQSVSGLVCCWHDCPFVPVFHGELLSVSGSVAACRRVGSVDGAESDVLKPGLGSDPLSHILSVESVENTKIKLSTV